MTNEVENKMNENVENTNINETNQIVESQNSEEMNEQSKTKTERKPRTFEEQSLCNLRRVMNVVSEKELIEKGYVCTFSETTHKLTSIKKKSDNPTNSETTEKSDAHYKNAFINLVKDLTEIGFVMSFTNSDRLRTIRQSYDMQKIRAEKKNAEPTNQTEQVAVAETVNQTEQIAA